MKTEWKDVAHLYLGCDGHYYYLNGNFSKEILIQIDTDGRCLSNNRKMVLSDFKPILRPLSDMTEEEEGEYWKIRGTGWTSETESQMIREATGTKYLLSKGFDLFGLIESSQAIDRTTLTSLTKLN